MRQKRTKQRYRNTLVVYLRLRRGWKEIFGLFTICSILGALWLKPGTVLSLVASVLIMVGQLRLNNRAIKQRETTDDARLSLALT